MFSKLVTCNNDSNNNDGEGGSHPWDACDLDKLVVNIKV